MKKNNRFNYKLGNGGKLKPPIIVNDKNDPRLKAYNDSLYIYNKGEKQLNEFRLQHEEQIENYNKTKPFYKPTVRRKEQTDKATFSDSETKYNGIDPIAYTFSQNPPVDTRLISIWGEDPEIGKFDKGFSFMPRYKRPSQPIEYKNKEIDKKPIQPIVLQKRKEVKELTPITNIQIPLDNIQPELKTITNNQPMKKKFMTKQIYTNKKGGYYNNGDNTGRQEFDLGGMITGAQAGSQMGSSFGPWGKIIGGVLGAAGGQVGDILGQNRELAGYDKIVNNTQLAFGGNMTESINAGGTHEQNPNEGVNIGNKGLVEEGEVKFNFKDNTGDNSYIFSKRLGFANKAKSIMKKFDIRSDDKMATEAKEQRLKGLMNEQEIVRSSMFDNQFKKTFGGKLKKYDGLQPWPSILENEPVDNVPLNELGDALYPTKSGFNTTGVMLRKPNVTPMKTIGTPKSFPTSTKTSTLKTAPVQPMGVDKPKVNNGYNKGLNKLGQYGQFAGPLSKLAVAAMGPDAVNLQRMKNHNINSLPEEIVASNDLNQVYNNLNKDIRNNAGSNAGTFLASRIASAGNQADKTSSTLSGIRSKYNEFNTRNNMAVDQFNTQTSHTEDDLRTREKDAVRTLLMDSASQAGNTLGNIKRDDAANDMQNTIINSMQTGNYKWGVNPENDKLALQYIQKTKQNALGGYIKGFGGFMHKSKMKSKKC